MPPDRLIMIVKALIAIGSNIGEPEKNVRESISRLASLGKISGRSSLYRTKPWGVVDQADFLNAVVALETELSCRELLTGIKAIETAMGRSETYRWGPRLIDLDILIFGDLSVSEPDLKIPHPHMLERLFVLVPLAEIDVRFAGDRDKLLAQLREGEEPPLRLE